MSIIRKLITAGGTETELIGPHSLQDIRALIGTDTLDVVSLRHMGNPLHIMLVDDNGHGRYSPINNKATRLYHANCITGTTHQIAGDVVIAPASDYAGF